MYVEGLVKGCGRMVKEEGGEGERREQKRKAVPSPVGSTRHWGQEWKR